MRYLLLLAPLLLTLGCRVTRYSYYDELAFRDAVQRGDSYAVSSHRAQRVHRSLKGVAVGSLAASAGLWGAAYYMNNDDRHSEAALLGILAFSFDVVALATGIVSGSFHRKSEFYKRLAIDNLRRKTQPHGTTGTYGASVPDPVGGVLHLKNKVRSDLARLPKPPIPRLPRIPIPGRR
ncbi:MAG: hypothetical protein ACYTFG_12640 [Planctomycetota bacterium]|jgi:hypothetical protein